MPPTRPSAPIARRPTSRRASIYKAFATRFRRGKVAVARPRATRKNSTAARLSRQSADPALQGVGGTRPRQPPPAPLDGPPQAEPQLGFRHGRRRARRCAPCPRLIISPGTALSLQGRARMSSSKDTIGHPADRQLRVDARAADQHRRDQRRHSGAHAGTAAGGQDRDLSASPPARGRAGRAVEALARLIGKPQKSRVASMTCATSSTNRPTNPGAAARRNLGLMMREGLLKENIDGEALDLGAQPPALFAPKNAAS